MYTYRPNEIPQPFRQGVQKQSGFDSPVSLTQTEERPESTVHALSLEPEQESDCSENKKEEKTISMESSHTSHSGNNAFGGNFLLVLILLLLLDSY